ncbi:Uncharacterised protein [Mycobacteroides abscessus subsp. abscessus]|nr:Uncharacterised protein [Mycobacteroides abscessus subsp. abscessus]
MVAPRDGCRRGVWAVDRQTKGIDMRDIAVEIVVEDDEIVTATEMVASH